MTILLLSVALFGNIAQAQVKVRGYTRKDGTYVRPHVRSNPDGNFHNNWSTAGNRNPYTGKYGTKTRPPERVTSGLPSRTTLTTRGTSRMGASTNFNAPFFFSGRSESPAAGHSINATRSGSRVRSNPFVVDEEVATVDQDLDELKRMLARVEILARDPSLPRWFRCVTAIQVLSELKLERLPANIQTQLQPRFSRINAVLARYSFTNGSDFQQLTDRDAQKILTQLREIAAIDLRIDSLAP